MDRVQSVPLQGNLKTNPHCKPGYNSLACFGENLHAQIFTKTQMIF